MTKAATEAHGPAQGRADVSRDAFLDGRLALLQPRRGPRAAIDGVLLSASIPIAKGVCAHVLDAGCGTGIVSLALAKRVASATVVGVERQGELADLARENAALNDLDTRAHFVTADITAKLTSLEALGLERESFDHAAANPPFYTEGEARPPLEPSKRDAHISDAGALDIWLRFLTAMTRPGGSVTLIHRPEALSRLLQAAEGRIGDICVFPLFAHAGEPAQRILVQGIKGSRAPVTLAAGMVLHHVSGAYREDVDAVLRGRSALTIRPGQR